MSASTVESPRILFAEDEMFVAMMIEDRLTDAGYRVIKAARLDAALQAAESADLDAAILDVNLGGEHSYPAADALRARKIPFFFSSGYGREGLDEAYRDDAVIQKPYDTKALLKALNACLGNA